VLVSDPRTNKLILYAFNIITIIQSRILDPIIFGEYPPIMQKILGNILPEFSSNDKEKLKSGLDFIGINYYTGYYVKDCIYSKCEPGPWITRTEGLFEQSALKDGVPIGKPVRIFNLT
jgi:beta-glucosidase/6-phospho-beta-glucosidase/beta-galactosidase